MNTIVNSLLRPLGWLIVPCKYTRRLFVVWLIVWIFIPSGFIIAQIATPQSNSARSRRNLQTLKDHSLRMDRLEGKSEYITEVMTSIKYLNEKIDSVAEIQKYVLLGVMGALALNLLNAFIKRHQDLLQVLNKKQDKPLGK